jgi:uncharacterized protein YlxW (UPF0749 family)
MHQTGDQEAGAAIHPWLRNINAQLVMQDRDSAKLRSKAVGMQAGKAQADQEVQRLQQDVQRLQQEARELKNSEAQAEEVHKL